MGLEAKLFVRENLTDDPKAKAHVLNKAILNADESSEFDQKKRKLLESMKDKPDEVIQTLASEGYDVMLGYVDKEIIGHMAYQEHKDNNRKNWQMFHFYINPECRNKNYPVPLAIEFVKKARQYEIPKVRLGAGGHKIMEKIIRILQKQKGEELNIKSDPDSHWVYLIKP